MAVLIREIVTEVVLGPPPQEEGAGAPETIDQDELVETIVRRATARVVELLRREWDG